MVWKTSEELFNESIEKGSEQARKRGETSKRIKELREEYNKAVVKSTFARSDAEKDKHSTQAKALKKQIDSLVALNE